MTLAAYKLIRTFSYILIVTWRSLSKNILEDSTTTIPVTIDISLNISQ